MTPRQLEVLRYVEDYSARQGVAPTLQELANHLGVSKVTALSHLRCLEKDRHIKRGYYRRRSIRVLTPTRKISVIGRIAAGRPIEAVTEPEELDALDVMKEGKEIFALQVQGESMIDDQIRSGDYVIVERRSTARNGETVVALLPDGDATLKRFYRENGKIRLQPANASMQPLVVKQVQIQGIVVGIYRKL